MLEMQVNRDEVHFGASLTVRFMRALRLPDDQEQGLPVTGLGEFPVYAVWEYASRVPVSWRVRSGVFIPMYDWEAMWISLSARWWKPNAVTVGVNNINALTGEPWQRSLSKQPQDYLVCPDQSCLVGFNAGDGHARQLAVKPVEGGLRDGSGHNGGDQIVSVQLAVFEPRVGLFPDQPRTPVQESGISTPMAACESLGGLGAVGGRLREHIRKDKYGFEAWDQTDSGFAEVYLVSARVFHKITGKHPPATPICRRHYLEAGLPWPVAYGREQSHGTPAPDQRGRPSTGHGAADEHRSGGGSADCLVMGT